MAIYHWKCASCGKEETKLLKSRPKLFTCCCGGKLEFINKLSTRIIEVRDNGLMPRKVEQLADIEELVKTRSTNPDEGETV